MDMFNDRAFSQSVDLDDLRRYVSSPGYIASKEPTVFYLMIIGLLSAFFSAVISFVVTTSLQTDIYNGAILFFSIIFAAVYVSGRILAAQEKRRQEYYYVRHRFANDNAMTFRMQDQDSHDEGLLFSAGNTKMSTRTEVFRSASGIFEMGNYSVVKTVNSRYAVSIWGYCKITLERSVPQIFLDSKKNDRSMYEGDGSFPIDFPKDQKVELEGDFSSHFTVYAPRGYDSDVRYILTPDLMATLLDESEGYDVEITGNTLFFYRPKAFDFSSKDDRASIERLVSSVGAKAHQRTERYSATADAPAHSHSLRKRLQKRAYVPLIVYGLALLIAILIKQWAQ